ncbi:MAG: aminomethyltransferase beta-barrel domain-containing protein, partial [Patescibacteria group bacterium]
KELYKKEIELTDLNLINPSYFLIRANKKIRRHELRVLARVRYRQPLRAAKVMGQGSGVKLIFAKPQKFVAPGQSAVFYSKRGELLGGGIIL